MVNIPLIALLLLQSAPTPGFETFAGSYQLVKEESDDVAKAIDRVVAKMSALTRGVARSRITPKNIAYPSVNITKEGAGFRINLEKGSNVVLSPGGPAVEWKTADGEIVQIRLLPDAREVITSKDGQRENHFSLAGGRLIIKAKVTSGSLPEPIEYKLVYRRQ